MLETMTCDVCQSNPPKGVASSALGPISWAYCQTCLDKNAEPSIMIVATVDGCGGADGVADWVRQINTFLDGEYVSFDEAAARLSTQQDGG